MDLSLAVNLPTFTCVLVEPLDRITIDGRVGLVEATVTEQQFSMLQGYSGVKTETTILIDIPEIEQRLKTIQTLDEEQDLVNELCQDAIAARAKFVLAVIE